jgi:protein-S-isoprenylcysteine O-methyltransferase Ste14
VGWLVMESASALLFALFFVLGTYHSLVSWVFLLMWESHYIHRAFIYPFSLSANGKRMPLLIVLFGLSFNTMNAYLNGRYLFSFSGGYDASWLKDPRFILGLLLFVVGYIVNRRSDATLRQIKLAGNGYKIPYGGLYSRVSCPNYLGESAIWTCWALATWSLPGLTFAVWTVANLAPRARANHAWYRERFADYPEERKALLPGLW